MSYDTSRDRNRRDGKNWQSTEIQQELLDDVERGSFLRDLDRAPFEVTNFEADFVNSFLTNTHLNWWTERRRETCDKMRKQYQGRL